MGDLVTSGLASNWVSPGFMIEFVYVRSDVKHTTHSCRSKQISAQMNNVAPPSIAHICQTYHHALVQWD